MKFLLDAMMPRELIEKFNQSVAHVGQMGWQDLQNGTLLTAAEQAGFSVLITKDGGIPYHQSLKGRNIGVVVIKLHSQRIDDLVSKIKDIQSAAEECQPGEVKILFLNKE